jgi:hypothetical protein
MPTNSGEEMSAPTYSAKDKKSFSRGWKSSNNAKLNRVVNKGMTAATVFYARWRP